jgi:hypothetical protein
MCLSPGVKCRIVLWPWREQHASQVQTVSYRDVETVLRTRIVVWRRKTCPSGCMRAQRAGMCLSPDGRYRTALAVA